MGEVGQGDIWGRESEDKGKGLARQERAWHVGGAEVSSGRQDLQSKGRSGERLQELVPGH